MPSESCLVKTMAQGARLRLHAVGGLTAGQEKEKTTERSNLHEMPTGSGNRLAQCALLIMSAKPTRKDKKREQAKIFKPTTLALFFQLAHRRRILVGEIRNGRRQGDGRRENADKRRAPSPLRVQGPVDESRRAVFASREGLTNCKPSNLYSNGVVDDPESCNMGDRLSIGGEHGGVGR
jgi:hypothetical protein